LLPIIILIVSLAAIAAIILAIRKRDAIPLTVDERTLLNAKEFGDFRLDALRKRSRVSSLFKAVHSPTGKVVFLRILHPQHSADPEQVGNFLRRGEVLDLLRKKHPKLPVTRILSFGEVNFRGLSRHFIATEFYEGHDLGELLASKGKLTPPESIEIILQGAEILGTVLRDRVWHHQLSLDAMIVRYTGPESRPEVRLMDYDVLKPPDSGVDSYPVKGIFQASFMSPEQIAGIIVDERSDVYSLGALFYTLLTGKAPFPPESLADIERSHKLPALPALPGTIPASVSEILFKMLSKQTSERFVSMGETAAALEKCAGALPWAITPQITPPRWYAVPFTKSGEEDSYVSRPPIPAGGQPRKTRTIWGGFVRRFRSIPQTPVITVGFVLPVFNWIAENLKKAGVILLAAIAGVIYLLWPRTTVTIETVPVGATVTVNGLPASDATPLKNLGLGKFNADTGRVVFGIRRTEYLPLDTPLVFTLGEHRDLSVALRPAAILELNVTPNNAVVELDGDTIAASRLSQLELPVGEHVLKVSSPAFLRRVDTLHLKQGKSNKHIIALTAVPDRLYLDSDPHGAVVSIADRQRGVTPFHNVDLAPGQYRITLSLDGYATVERNVNLSSARPESVFVRMEQAGMVNIALPPDANAFLDGKSVDAAALRSVSTGNRTLTVKRAGFRDFVQSIFVSPQKPVSVDLTSMVPLLGKLTFHVTPAADIFLNDQPLLQNVTLRETTVPIGTSTVRIEAGPWKWQKDINVVATKTQTLTVDFNVHSLVMVIATDETGKPIKTTKIYIDNKPTEEYTYMYTQVRVGLHTFEVRGSGYRMVDGPKRINIEEETKGPIKFILKRDK
jgi:serine/threonine protein kinase